MSCTIFAEEAFRDASKALRWELNMKRANPSIKFYLGLLGAVVLFAILRIVHALKHRFLP